MSFLNLGLGELIGLIGIISAGVVALYLLDRSSLRSDSGRLPTSARSSNGAIASSSPGVSCCN